MDAIELLQQHALDYFFHYSEKFNSLPPILVLVYTLILVALYTKFSSSRYTSVSLTFRIKHYFFKLILNTPIIGRFVRQELDTAGKELRESLIFNTKTDDRLPKSVQLYNRTVLK